MDVISQMSSQGRRKAEPENVAAGNAVNFIMDLRNLLLKLYP